MIRRSLRIGIRLGLLTGIAFALFKIFQSRRTSPALPDGDGWAPASDRSPSPGPVLVRPTMPERSVSRRDAAAGAGVEPSASVAPGPSEPFAMVEPEVASVDASAADDVPLDAVAGPTVEVGDPAAVAPQAEPMPSPSPAPAPRKAPAAKAARKAAQTPLAATGTGAPGVPGDAGAGAAVTKSAVKKARAKKAAVKKAATKAPAKKGAAKKAAAKKGAAKKAAAKKAVGKKAAAKKAAGKKAAGWAEPTGRT